MKNTRWLIESAQFPIEREPPEFYRSSSKRAHTKKRNNEIVDCWSWCEILTKSYLDYNLNGVYYALPTVCPLITLFLSFIHVYMDRFFCLDFYLVQMVAHNKWLTRTFCQRHRMPLFCLCRFYLHYLRTVSHIDVCAGTWTTLLLLLLFARLTCSLRSCVIYVFVLVKLIYQVKL